MPAQAIGLQRYSCSLPHGVRRDRRLTPPPSYGVHQSAYGSDTQAGCSTNAHSVCSGSLEALSFDADYRINVHLDVYASAMYSAVHDGMANGYLNTTNVNPTIGVRYRF